MTLWQEYRELWREAFDDSDIRRMFFARFCILLVHAGVCAIALLVLVSLP